MKSKRIRRNKTTSTGEAHIYHVCYHREKGIEDKNSSTVKDYQGRTRLRMKTAAIECVGLSGPTHRTCHLYNISLGYGVFSIIQVIIWVLQTAALLKLQGTKQQTGRVCDSLVNTAQYLTAKDPH